jgi:hypothetical protein
MNNTRRKTANPTPCALLEVTNVLTIATGPSIITTMSKLKFTLQKKFDEEGDEEADKDWGVSVVNEDRIPASFKTFMIETILQVDKVKLLATL